MPHLESHTPRNVEEDGVPATRGPHQDGDLLGVTRLVRGLRLGLLAVGGAGVRGHAARGRVDRQEHLLRSDLRHLQMRVRS